MQFRKRNVLRAAFLAVLLIGLTAAVAVFGGGPIQEEDATILQTFTGEAVGDAFGWVGENLGGERLLSGRDALGSVNSRQ